MRKSSLPRNLIIVSLTSLLTDISSEMVYPVLPLFLVGALGATPAIVGLIEGVAECLASLLKVFSGRWSDILGRRKPLTIGGYGASVVGRILLYLSVFMAGWWLVLAGRVVDRFGKGIRGAPCDALIAETVPKDQLGHAFGFHRAMDTLGAVLGVVFAYFVFTTFSKSAFSTLFLVSLIPAALGTLALVLVREPRRAGRDRTSPGTSEKPPKPSIRAAWTAAPSRLKWFLVISLVFALGNSSNQFLLLRAGDSLHFSAANVILLYLVFNITYAAGSYPLGRLSDLIGRRTLLMAGYAIYGVVYLGFAWLHNPAAAWGLFAAYGLYMAATDGIEKALVAELAPPEAKATLLGLHAMLVGIGLLPASIIAGLLWDHVGPDAPFYLGGALGLLAAAAMWRVL